MALKVLSKIQTLEYVSEKDPDTTNPTIFILGSISAEDRAVAQDYMAPISMSRETGAEVHMSHKGILEGHKFIVSKGLKDIKNLDGDYKWTGKADDIILAYLSETGILTELANKILEINSLGDEVKN